MQASKRQKRFFFGGEFKNLEGKMKLNAAALEICLFQKNFFSITFSALELRSNEAQRSKDETFDLILCVGRSRVKLQGKKTLSFRSSFSSGKATSWAGENRKERKKSDI
ncbi:hypothetical protein KFK09_029115 [Dendrobium nobile]|uniref:Uncharacterized protein n=1 Tax=Dendrobium nobile TaxID=94219 RepID=A0A8T3A9P6_DENNO|nr:hypothetical protein KFK09_029115 [Dendrobium nobile]